jgi:predicted transcriptional regulator
LTPIYQQRLREISPLQRQIVELLCSESRTLNPKKIARRLLLTEQSVGKQIRNLVEIGYLTSQKKKRVLVGDCSLLADVNEESAATG